ncbi:MAG TPA: hypothetical protein VMS37_12960 [Verrucomicrobiae bacterium]|nr:hypothetical protein [Verrucomicrobiae bacterium]
MVSSEPPVSENEKREALEAVLNSSTFARSAQLRAFLRYVCEMELAGRTAEVSEYQIAVEVLGRREDIDLTDDSSVRNRAYELRQRLEKYYSSEQPHAPVRIEIPRGGYVPTFLRHSAEVPALTTPLVVVSESHGSRWLPLVAVAAVCAVAGYLIGSLGQRPHPPAILEEAWGPMADPGGDMLISIATNLHLLIRPHVPPRASRMPVPRELYPLYGTTRPLDPADTLYMEPAQLSIPLGELSAAATLASTRAAFGGSYQILPESEAPLTALLGRNGVLFGTPVNSKAATVLLRTVPLTIGFTPNDEFAVIDQRKPTGQGVLYTPYGADPGPSTQYGLHTVLTGADRFGKPRRTLQLTGTGTSAALQSAVEFFCSASSMRDLRQRFAAQGVHGFPPNYQVVVLCITSGVRLISCQYEMHVIVDKPLGPMRALVSSLRPPLPTAAPPSGSAPLPPSGSRRNWHS